MFASSCIESVNIIGKNVNIYGTKTNPAQSTIHSIAIAIQGYGDLNVLPYLRSVHQPFVDGDLFNNATNRTPTAFSSGAEVARAAMSIPTLNASTQN